MKGSMLERTYPCRAISLAWQSRAHKLTESGTSKGPVECDCKPVLLQQLAIGGLAISKALK